MPCPPASWSPYRRAGRHRPRPRKPSSSRPLHDVVKPLQILDIGLRPIILRDRPLELEVVLEETASSGPVTATERLPIFHYYLLRFHHLIAHGILWILYNSGRVLRDT